MIFIAKLYGREFMTKKEAAKPRLTELVDLEKDIVPYDLNVIYAGVGAGKNSIIVGYHDDYTDYDGLAEKYRVLLITSRKAKVIETKHDENGKNLLTDIRSMDTIRWDKLKSKSVICTNAHFQQRVKDWWEPLLDNKPFWEEFDFVVIDEFHSIVSDATFADSSCIVYYLMDQLYNECLRKSGTSQHKTKLVLMTGTPEPVEPLIKKYNPHILDYRQKALCISPNEYCIYNYESSKRKMLETLLRGEIAVYYLALFDNLEDIISEALSAGIREEQIVVSVSDSRINKELQKNHSTIFKNIEIFDQALANEKIPEQFLLTITNSRNKEGINIKTYVDSLIIETHLQSDIVQICGRFRNGVRRVVIVSDAEQFEIQLLHAEEETYQWDYAIRSANTYLEQILKEENLDPRNESLYRNKRVQNFIDYIEKNTRLLRYNPFIYRFDKNPCFLQAYRFYNDSIAAFSHFIDDPTRISLFVLDKDINVRIKTDYFTTQEIIEDYFFDKKYVIGETIFTRENGIEMLKELNILLHRVFKKAKKYTQLKSLLKVYGYDTKRIGKTERGQFVIVPHVVKGEKD